MRIINSVSIKHATRRISIDLKYQGSISRFAWKRKIQNTLEMCVEWWIDAIVLVSPIYVGDVTCMMN